MRPEPMDDAEPRDALRPDGATPSPETPMCWRCGRPSREGARFCGHCGMALSAEDFLVPARARAPLPRVGLGVALTTYFALLAALLAMLVAEIASVRTVLLFDVGILAGAVVMFVAYWPELGSLLGAPRGIGARELAVSVVALAGVFGLVELLAALFPELFADLMQSYRAEGVGLGFAVFQIGPLTALGEELLFRGVVLTGLRATFPDRVAIAVSAAMFATIHLSPVAFLHTGILGVLFGWLTVRSGSLWPSILVHAAWNTAMVLLDA